jgi:NAD(P)H dehydrogenase (quinone)
MTQTAPVKAPTLAVTGSTGFLGGLVARNLSRAGVAQRLVTRDVARTPALDGAVPVPFSSYADPASATAALTGVDTLLMVSGSESADRLDQHRTFVEAARAAGVRHVVYTSFIGAAPDAIFTLGRDHYATEEYIKAAGLTYTFLRDSFYLDFMPELVGEDGVIRGPAGDGRVGAVARADIARVATVVLQHPGDHRNQTYDLTGSEALTLAEAAEQLSAARGTPVTFHNETIEEAYASRAKWGAPGWQNDAWVSTYTAIAAGELAAVTSTVTDITGRPPLTLAEMLAGTSQDA